MQHKKIQDYYGKVLEGSHDLKTDACCTQDGMPGFAKAALSLIHNEVMSRYYGCGLVFPQCMEGLKVLDLGCGAGRDVYVLSHLVGPKGFVVGVDMTDEQLAVAEQHVDYHTKAFGYDRPNVAFHKGYIEELDKLGLEPGSFDLIVSNCVVNLSPDKQAVLDGAWKLLKPGGEMYFSDVYTDRRVPEELVLDPVLLGECLSGALYWNDFLRIANQAGFADPRLTEDRPLVIENEAIKERLGNINFFSATYRLFKLDGLESACEDYGQAVKYRGTAPHSEASFELDNGHTLEAGRLTPVCGNTYRMLKDTRFAEHFEFFGDRDTHYGIFAGCGTDLPFGSAGGDRKDGGSCC